MGFGYNVPYIPIMYSGKINKFKKNGKLSFKGDSMGGAYNLVRNESLYLELTPWTEDEILRPFRWYYSKSSKIGSLNPRTIAILLTRTETGAGTYTMALYLSRTLRAKLKSLQAIASWKRQISTESLIKNVRKTPKPVTSEHIFEAIKSGIEKALIKLDGISIKNTKSKVPHWIIKAHISKVLSKHTISLVEWTSGNRRYDLYLPLEDVRIEVKYAWGYTVNYYEYAQKGRDIYVIVGKNVSWDKLRRMSETKNTKYVLYRTDYGRFFSNMVDFG